MKKHGSTIILVLILLIGLSLILYPSFADYWNSFTQSYAVTDYIKNVAVLDEAKYEAIWQAAADYNTRLKERASQYALESVLKLEYHTLLDVGGTGIMGYISIPDIDVNLPIHHGTEDTVLQVAIGHLEWTSLPVGGESTHCVVSGHRGLPSARLFTDLDDLEVGSVFMLNVLDEVLTYQVDQIKIVLPHETDDLLIVEGEDYCTLVTCTPYGVNSHRMLVRGTRIDNIEEARVVRVTADAVRIEPIIVAPLLAIPVLLVLFIALLIPKPKKNRRKES